MTHDTHPSRRPAAARSAARRASASSFSACFSAFTGEVPIGAVRAGDVDRGGEYGVCIFLRARPPVQRRQVAATRTLDALERLTGDPAAASARVRAF